MERYDVFICYRGNEGGVLAANIYSELCLYTNNKLKIFFAPRCVPHGSNFRDACLMTAGTVSLLIMILSPDFFAGCDQPDDIVYGELKNALKNASTRFLPILMPGFDFKDVDLSPFFDETEIDRIKHISAIKFTDVYSFSSADLLIPILRDRMGKEIFQSGDDGTASPVRMRTHIGDKGKKHFFTDANKTEQRRLRQQQALLKKFDLPAYDKLLCGKEGVDVLDLGSGNGLAVMERLGGRSEVSRLIGLEYDPSLVQRANDTYAGSKAKFYCADLESEDLEDRLLEIMEENGIRQFGFVNILATVSHLKSPFQVLRRIKKVCKKGAPILIRNVDDGLNLCYPDEKGHYARALSLLAQCEATGYRYSGRELFTLLKRSGYRKIELFAAGLNTIGLDYEERSALFDVVFKFVKQGIHTAAENHPDDIRLREDAAWLDSVYYDLEEGFLSEDFFMNMGFMLYTAEV